MRRARNGAAGTLRGALALTLALLSTSASCGDGGRVTEIIVAIDSDIAGLTEVRVEVDFFSDERIARTTLDPAAPVLPQTLGLIHQGGPLGPIDIEATGFIQADKVAVRRLARVSFVEGEKMLLRMELTQDCVGIFETCGEGDTCVDGRCATATVAVSELERYHGDPGRTLVSAPSAAPRAGDPAAPPVTGSAGGAPAGPRDAGTPGSPVPDAGPAPVMDAGTPGVINVPGASEPPMGTCADDAVALATASCHSQGVRCFGPLCGHICDLGWDDCDDDFDNGCETSLNTASDCGMCGRVCPTDAPGARGCNCVLGEPRLQCIGVVLPFRADCDGDLDNGCEAYLDSNDNCGMCGRQCDCQDFQCASGSGNGGPGGN